MAVLCRIYGSNTYSNIYATYDTDGDSEPGKYTSGLYLRNGAAGIEYDASNSETLNIIHGYAGGAASNMYFKFGALSGPGNFASLTLSNDISFSFIFADFFYFVIQPSK